MLLKFWCNFETWMLLLLLWWCCFAVMLLTILQIDDEYMRSHAYCPCCCVLIEMLNEHIMLLPFCCNFESWMCACYAVYMLSCTCVLLDMMLINICCHAFWILVEIACWWWACFDYMINNRIDAANALVFIPNFPWPDFPCLCVFCWLINIAHWWYFMATFFANTVVHVLLILMMNLVDECMILLLCLSCS